MYRARVCAAEDKRAWSDIPDFDFRALEMAAPSAAAGGGAVREMGGFVSDGCRTRFGVHVGRRGGARPRWQGT